MIVNKIPKKIKTGVVATVDEAKKQLNIEAEFTEDDDYIATLIAVATGSLENDTNSDLLDTENEVTFQADTVTDCTIHAAPFRNIVKAEYYKDGTWYEIAAEDYEAEEYFHSFEVKFKNRISCEKMRLTYMTGYEAGSYPAELKHAVLIRCSDMFDTERQGYNANNMVANQAYQRLIAKHTRKYW